MWLATVVAGCAVQDRQSIQFPIVSGGAGQATFDTADGGSVELTAASVTFTDVRLEEPPADEGPVAWYERLSPISSAYAHPGHDYPGAVNAELLGTFTVDLLADDVTLGTVAGYEGDFATGRVSVDGTVAALAGTCHRADGTTDPFSFAVAASQDIIGIPFVETLHAERPPTSVDLRFDPERALSFVDWSVTDQDADGVLTVADGSYGNTALFGVVATPTWSLTLVP